MPLDMEMKAALSEFAQEITKDARKSVEDALVKRDDKSNELHEQIEHLKTKSEKDSTDIKGRLDETKSEMERLTKEVEAAQRKLDAAGRGLDRVKSLGAKFIDSDEFKAINWQSKPSSFSMDLKDITNAGNVATGVSRNVLVPEQDSGFAAPAQIEMRVRSLFPSGGTSSNAIRFRKETGFTNNAAPVAEGATKPESNITFGEVVLPVQKIAHFIDASMEVLNDAPMLMSYIDNRLRYGLDLVEETQLLTGSGTGSNLTGVLPQATAFSATTIASYTPADVVDRVRVGKLQVRKALWPASGVVMSPETWAQIELMKDGDGRYIYSMVTSGATPALWGMPVVVSDSITPGDFLVGAFALGGQIWDRMGTTVMVSTEDGSNFKNNMVTILAEKRLALEITRPEAFVWYDASA